jgi:transcriptional regulator with XRE-family HTH domain
MAQFYKELKQLRTSRGISLEEISDRTKINIKYIKSIESGDFINIEIPYLRLFLRAYADEIGGDSQRALEQLDSFMGTNTTPLSSSFNIKNENTEEFDYINDTLHSVKNSSQKIRNDLIKTIILIGIFIFSMVVLKKVFNDSSSVQLTENGPISKKETLSISKKELDLNYIIDNESEEILLTKAPFIIKLRALKKVNYSFKNDTLNHISNFVHSNWDQNLDPFINQSELFFSTTIGLTLYINGVNIQNISDYEHPLRIIIKPSPPSMIIQRYKPIS